MMVMGTFVDPSSEPLYLSSLVLILMLPLDIFSFVSWSTPYVQENSTPCMSVIVFQMLCTFPAFRVLVECVGWIEHEGLSVKFLVASSPTSA